MTLMSRAEPTSHSFPLYRFAPPRGWTRMDSGLPASEDTMKPLAHFSLRVGEEQLDLTVHNFPVDRIEERTPLQAQIARWKGQFDTIEPTSIHTRPQAFGGFVGLAFEAEGTRQQAPYAVMAWTMQLAPQFYTALELLDTPQKHFKTRQLYADFTIKAYGSPKLLAQERVPIEAAARSLALEEELPQSL